MTVSDALKTSQFWTIYLMAFCSIFQGYYVLNVFKDYGQTVSILKDDAFLTQVGSAASILNTMRFLWSGAMDLNILKGRSLKTVYGFQLAMQAIFGMTLSWAAQSRSLYTIWVCLILWMEGAHFVIIPSAIKSIFGQEADKIYAILFSYSGISAILMLFIVTSKFGSNYESVFQLSAMLSIAAFVLLIGAFKET